MKCTDQYYGRAFLSSTVCAVRCIWPHHHQVKDWPVCIRPLLVQLSKVLNNVLNLTKSPHTKLEKKVSLNHQLFLRIYSDMVSLVGGCLTTLMLRKILRITVIDVRKCYGDVLLEFLLNYTQEGHRNKLYSILRIFLSSF